MKFLISNFKSSSFSGTVSVKDLPQTYQDKLETDGEVSFEGEYSVEWDYDIPMPVIEYIALDTGNKCIEIDLDDLGNELFDLEEQISQSDDGSWEIDRISHMADDAYDRMKDAEYEQGE